MEEEKIVLTLDSQEEIKEEAKEEKQISKEEVEANMINNMGLNEEEKKMVDDFAKKIDIEDTTMSIQYGSGAQSKVASFSDTALSKVRTKDADNVGEILTNLLGQLKGFKIEENDNFFAKIFKKTANNITGLKDKYDSIEDNVEDIVKILEEHQITLLKDISLLDQLYEKNLVNQKEVSMYILAGYKALKEFKDTKLKEAIEKAQQTGKPEDAQIANDLSNAAVRFEKRLHDLELTRVVSIQTAPQIRLIQNNDTTMVEKIQSVIVNTIPLWKSQMLIALGIAHSKEAVRAENEVTEMTNKLLKQNAETLKQATIDTAKASERGIVDVETLTETNRKLIETLEEVKKIQDEGRQQREKAKAELLRIENELKEKLVNIVK